jgi:squalene-associated FAD-dependent desaturase
LSAAVRLAEAGRPVVVHEAAGSAGGRCRSYFDPALGLTIDNGNHLLLSGNGAAIDFLARIGARSALSGPAEAVYPFADLATGDRWVLRLNDGRLPWWVFDPRRRVPGTQPWDYLAPFRIASAPSSATIGDAMHCEGSLYDRLWRPLLLAALNTEPSEASAGLATRLLHETFAKGGRACRPLIAKGLSAAFVDPALQYLSGKDMPVQFNRRLRSIAFSGDRPHALDFSGTRIALAAEDAVVLAVPPWIASELVPNLVAPRSFRAIVNAHFRVRPPPDFPPLFGIVNGIGEWLFAFQDRLSVTISNADRFLGEPRQALAEAIWSEVSKLSGLGTSLPPWQIVKERRATFASTPAEVARRPPTRTRFRGLILAGDWIATGLPATIEGAIRSGYAAAAAVSGISSASLLRTAA